MYMYMCMYIIQRNTSRTGRKWAVNARRCLINCTQQCGRKCNMNFPFLGKRRNEIQPCGQHLKTYRMVKETSLNILLCSSQKLQGKQPESTAKNPFFFPGTVPTSFQVCPPEFYILCVSDGEFYITRQDKINLLLFSSLQNFKTLQDSTSHRIFERMHEVLNIAKQNN